MKVLLIEESETCSECLLGIYNKRWFCLATNKDIDLLKSRYEKPSWCPLRPLPCKKHMRQMPSDVLEMGKRKRDYIIHRVDVDNAYAMGWNDCIEYLMTGKDADAELNDLLGEILGETE